MLTVQHVLRWAILTICLLGIAAAQRSTVHGCRCKLNYQVGSKRYLGGSCVPGKNGGRPWCQVLLWTCKSALPQGANADVCGAMKPTPAPKKSQNTAPKVVTKKTSTPKVAPISNKRTTNRRSGGCSDPGGWRSEILDLHNKKRGLHGAQELCWDDEVEATASAWSNRCQWGHSGGGNGENIARMYGDDWGTVFGMWYSEGNNYPYGAGTSPYSLMHFTQVVWKGTQKLGCSKTNCGMGDFYVCQYYPPGNYMGLFDENVGRPGSGRKL